MKMRAYTIAFLASVAASGFLPLGGQQMESSAAASGILPLGGQQMESSAAASGFLPLGGQQMESSAAASGILPLGGQQMESSAAASGFLPLGGQQMESSAAASGILPLGGQPIKSTVNAEPFDVVINELMVRPAPVRYLPDAEYIELFNRSAKSLNLKGWTVHVGNRYRSLPDITILPGGFLLLTHEKNEELLEKYGDVVAIPGFPVLAMGGQTVVLRNETGMVISAVNYSDTWYGSSFKSAGGWSLEQKDPFNPCGGAANWTASQSISGGTPGRPNSVLKSNPDTVPPALLRATVSTSGSIRLHFSEPMHPSSGWSPYSYNIEGAGRPLAVIPSAPLFMETDLFFNHDFGPGKDYYVEISAELYDCAGNFTGDGNRTARFMVAEAPGPGDIIINEVLFNPLPGGARFIELYNRSARTFDLRHILITDIVNGKPGTARVAAPGGYLLFAGEFAVLTTDPENVKMHYLAAGPDKFIMVERLPPMNNAGGRLAITDLNFNIIDEMAYSASMHSPALADDKGVSLERISCSRPSSDPTNWLSASRSSGYATPGYRNSQFSDNQKRNPGRLSVDPDIFSPDNSGYNDVVNIHYELDKPGYTANITIFDSRGRRIRRLANNHILGSSGTYSWDGRNDANMLSKLGIYLIYMELFHPDGDTGSHRQTVVLAGRFRE
ncbi:MAG: hypothetical protein EA408_02970 [Marinilabiliales bacterium]|nr:MAG: hypothetical protein EA408_02970 [Marinilabiliales bacterium]